MPYSLFSALNRAYVIFRAAPILSEDRQTHFSELNVSHNAL